MPKRIKRPRVLRFFGRTRKSEAKTYTDYLEEARRLDNERGLIAWQNDPVSDDYDYGLIQRSLDTLKSYRKESRFLDLAFYLRQALARNLGNIGNPALYSICRSGTKNLIHEYVSEVVSALNFLTDESIPGFSRKEKIKLITDIKNSYGRTAILLSGGGTLGLFHLGVVQALWNEGLLPRIFSGSSIGSLMAALVGTRDDKEIRSTFNPENLNLDVWRYGTFSEIKHHKVAFNQDHFGQCIRQDIGDFTFAEAYEKTGRVINISVTCASGNHETRLLNHLTTPHIVIWSACLASCAMIGVFPPTGMVQKNRQGMIVPYMHHLQWFDGSLKNDLPMRRLAELFNVNFHIVSQANPHVFPFLSPKSKPSFLRRATMDHAVATLKHHARHGVDMAHRLARGTRWDRILGSVLGVIDQKYEGHITITPPVHLPSILKAFSHLSTDDARRLITWGEQATWEHMAQIHNQTKIAQTLERCQRRLRNPGVRILSTEMGL